MTRGAQVLERCDISRSIYGISSSRRGARKIEKCDISRSICGISNTPRVDSGQWTVDSGQWMVTIFTIVTLTLVTVVILGTV